MIRLQKEKLYGLFWIYKEDYLGTYYREFYNNLP